MTTRKASRNTPKKLKPFLRTLLKTFLEAGLAMDRVTIYMHIAIAHLPEQIRRVCSLSKGSSQGAERMHQDMHDLTKNHTNKQADNVCGTALEKVNSKLDAMRNKKIEKRRGPVKLMCYPEDTSARLIRCYGIPLITKRKSSSAIKHSEKR